MDVGTIQKTITLFRKSFEELHANMPLIEIESLAIMVHEAMTVQARSFHTPEHIFDLSDASNPVQALAALFHDVVYYQIDEGFTDQIRGVIGPYIRERDEQLFIVKQVNPEDISFQLTLDVFGFRAGQVLPPFRGQNEFLSALLMNKKLEHVVTTCDLLKATACIETTIPFRGRNDNRETPPEILSHRLKDINTRYGLQMAPEEIEETVKWAVVFSNKDVENFSEQNTGRFLDNTWKLLPETNPSLRTGGIYSIGSYRRAMANMEAFLSQLDPETVFNRYKDEPPPGRYQRMMALAHRNIFTGRQYLGIKLLAATILEALAEITGGDVPLALFMGDIEGREEKRRLDDFLPDVPVPASIDFSTTLFGLLAFGRASSSSFDMQNSPLALFIYKLLGWDNIKPLLNIVYQKNEGEIDARSFLDHMPTAMMVSIANACAQIANTRSAALQAYATHRAQNLPWPTQTPDDA